MVALSLDDGYWGRMVNVGFLPAVIIFMLFIVHFGITQIVCALGPVAHMQVGPLLSVDPPLLVNFHLLQSLLCEDVVLLHQLFSYVIHGSPLVVLFCLCQICCATSRKVSYAAAVLLRLFVLIVFPWCIHRFPNTVVGRAGQKVAGVSVNTLLDE